MCLNKHFLYVYVSKNLKFIYLNNKKGYEDN